MIFHVKASAEYPCLNAEKQFIYIYNEISLKKHKNKECMGFFSLVQSISE